ncbi:restriction endonuclease subunit S [Pseudomonas sp. B21-017]|uniref:restriction endonuclease subunit S n=1 Tax=Pseudomonas sp. B21-017 TaxID=2895474 RepID=UPI00215E99F4|nr:restriction endonuclease subunit S [Pseudomonas sp. B21-017]UVM39528.1 restriction endonuclease subunit S [Pseudomonas sp. B21-017]
MSWPMVKLGKVCKLVNGDRGTNYPSKDSILSSGIPFINAGNLTEGHSIVCSGANFISEERYDLLSNGKVQYGDILFCLRGSLGKFAVVDSSVPKGAIASSLVIIRPDKSICEDYLKNYLRSTLCAREISRFGNGAAQPNLSAKDLREFEIPLPPLPEQKRIAAILDKADAIRRKRQQAIQLVDDFLHAVFLDMFGDPVTNPKGWEVKPLGHLVVNKDGKRVPIKASDRTDMAGEYPYYGASGVIDYVNDFIFEGQHLLIGEDGANLLARSTPIAFIADGRYWVNNHAHVLGVKNGFSLDYLAFSINMRGLESFVSGSAQPKLNQENLNKIPIQVPPLGLVDKFSAVLKKHQAYMGKMSIAESEDLFSSLSQRAFSGQL